MLGPGGLIHGSLWIHNHRHHLHYWTAEGVLRSSLSRPARVILLGSLKPVRKQLLSDIPGPSPFAFYGADALSYMFRYRIKG